MVVAIFEDCYEDTEDLLVGEDGAKGIVGKLANWAGNCCLASASYDELYHAYIAVDVAEKMVAEF